MGKVSGIDPEMAKRINLAVERAGGRSAVLSKTSISSSSLDRYARGETEMSASRLAELSQLAGVSVDWLIFGRDGPPVLGKFGTATQDDWFEGGQSLADDNLVYIPLSNAVASAGMGIANSEVNELQRLPFSRSVLRQHGVAPDKAQFITARGDSMEPTIMDGGIVLMDVSRRELQTPGIYVLTIDDALLIKRVDPGLMGLRLISDNKAYPDEVVSRSEASRRVNVVGKVFWVGGPL